MCVLFFINDDGATPYANLIIMLVSHKKFLTVTDNCYYRGKPNRRDMKLQPLIKRKLIQKGLCAEVWCGFNKPRNYFFGKFSARN